MRAKYAFLYLLLLCSSFSSIARTSPAPTPLTITGLGKATAPLDGTWQFHTGDDSTWASPTLDDSTWECIQTDKPWGAQQHFGYTGYAWYRRHIDFAPATEPKLDLSLSIGYIDDVYEIYWNGTKIGGFGKMPPDRNCSGALRRKSTLWAKPQSGVLAIRVWKKVPASFDSGLLGGLVAPPLIGSNDAITSYDAERKYAWLKSRLYSAASSFSMGWSAPSVSWHGSQSQPQASPLDGALCLHSTRSAAPVRLSDPHPLQLVSSLQQPFFAMQDISLWFLLLYLLQLDDNPRLVRWTKIFASVSIISAGIDGLLGLIDPSGPLGHFAQLADAVCTVVTTAVEIWPLVLIPFAFKKRQSIATWLVAFFAFLSEMISVVASPPNKDIDSPTGPSPTGFRLHSSPSITIRSTSIFSPGHFLFFSIVYAVYRYSVDENKRQSAVDQEFKSAQELQRILIPETLPPIPGFAVTSAYRPAQEVGGDFFQLITKSEGGSLFILGDVSGKGLKAAMTVSLIVGTVRTLAEMFEDPAEILSGLNRRLHNRLQQGFVTCLILRLDPDGTCIFANAGHLPPFLNQNELKVPPALPLGLVASASYDEGHHQSRTRRPPHPLHRRPPRSPQPLRRDLQLRPPATAHRHQTRRQASQ